MHLLRPLRRGLPRGCDRGRAEFRIRHGNARGADVQQGTSFGKRRAMGGGNRKAARARCPVSMSIDVSIDERGSGAMAVNRVLQTAMKTCRAKIAVIGSE